MRQRSTILVATALLTVLFAAGSLRAQTAAPKGFPTGDDQAKQQWIQSNPDAYRSMGGQVEETPKSTLSKEETLKKGDPNDSKGTTSQAIATGPQASAMPWGAPENKAAWIASHPAEYAQMTGTTTSSTPVAPWGAPENKAAWKAAHPEQFEQLNATGHYSDKEVLTEDQIKALQHQQDGNE